MPYRRYGRRRRSRYSSGYNRLGYGGNTGYNTGYQPRYYRSGYSSYRSPNTGEIVYGPRRNRISRWRSNLEAFIRKLELERKRREEEEARERAAAERLARLEAARRRRELAAERERARREEERAEREGEERRRRELEEKRAARERREREAREREEKEEREREEKERREREARERAEAEEERVERERIARERRLERERERARREREEREREEEEERRERERIATERRLARERREREARERAEREERERERERERRENARREEIARREREEREREERERAEIEEAERLEREEERLREERARENMDLKVLSVDLHLKDNTERHHTDKYDMEDEDLVVRRGEEFTITIKFDKKYQKELHDLRLMFELGPVPNRYNFTSTSLLMNESRVQKKDPYEWHAHLLGNDNSDEIIVGVHFPSTCAIGDWELSIKTRSQNSNGPTSKYTHDKSIYVLFNPWCEFDDVYMPDQELLNEYVLCDTTVLFRGRHNRISAKRWALGQFNEGILDISLDLLFKYFKKNYHKMKNPVHVSRAISGIINGNDDGGVLTGNWSGNYDGGTRPTKWNGSINILKEYREKNVPVKYGQCWVFSGLCTTVCRAIGLPTKSVTCFSSAHDTNANTIIDKYIDDKGEVVSAGHDSIWNYHVWNECWMKRRDLDLDGKYDGWQAIDATPQELSDGLFICGPAPVSAIKRGDISKMYDCDFVFAEVNSDIAYWKYKDFYENNQVPVNIEKNGTGKKIYSKMPTGKIWVKPYNYERNGDPNNVTDHYKFPEDSVENRIAVSRAQKYAMGTPLEYIVDTAVTIEIVEPDEISIGENFTVDYSVKNNSGEEKKLKELKITLKATSYTGDANNRTSVKTDTLTDVRLDNKDLKGEIKVSVNDYIDLISDDAFIQAVAIGNIDDDGEDKAIMSSMTFRLRRPDLTVTTKKTCKIGEKINVEMSFQNPLNRPLKDCQLQISADGFFKVYDRDERDVPPNSVWKTTVEMTARRKGHQEIIATLDTKEIPDISGDCDVFVI